MKRYRYLQVAEWEACALVAGSMTQKRVPVALFHHLPKPGALLWVQEPFVRLEGQGRDETFGAVLYRADAGPAGGFPPSPPETRRFHCRTRVCEAREMCGGESRLTLEVTRAWQRPWSYFEIGDREREGLLFLKQAAPHGKLSDAWTEYWRRSYPADCQPAGDALGDPVLVLQFRVHKLNISELLRQRAQKDFSRGDAETRSSRVIPGAPSGAGREPISAASAAQDSLRASASPRENTSSSPPGKAVA